MTMIKRRAAGAAVPRHGGQPVALVVLCTLLFLTFLDNTVVSVGLGSVQADLHAGVLALQWVVGAYALTFASAMLGFGMVGDEFGRAPPATRTDLRPSRAGTFVPRHGLFAPRSLDASAGREGELGRTDGPGGAGYVPNG